MHYRISIAGLSPIIQNCGTSGLDIRSELHQEKASLTRKKTASRTVVEDARIAELECAISVWKDDEGLPTIPTTAFRTTIENAAKKFKEGPMVREGLIVLSSEFSYDKEKYGSSLEEVAKKAQFRIGVVVNRARILKTRARFDEWSAVFTVETDDEIIDRENLVKWVDVAGRRVGLGDWRPQKSGHHGRFELVEITQA